MEARKKGTIIVPITSSGLHLFGAVNGHKNHLARIVSDPIEVSSGSGYAQHVRCVPCGALFMRVDGEFLRQKAELSDLEGLEEYIQEEIRDLQGNLNRLRRYIKRFNEN